MAGISNAGRVKQPYQRNPSLCQRAKNWFLRKTEIKLPRDIENKLVSLVGKMDKSFKGALGEDLGQAAEIGVVLTGCTVAGIAIYFGGKQIVLTANKLGKPLINWATKIAAAHPGATVTATAGGSTAVTKSPLKQVQIGQYVIRSAKDIENYRNAAISIMHRLPSLKGNPNFLREAKLFLNVSAKYFSNSDMYARVVESLTKHNLTGLLFTK